MYDSPSQNDILNNGLFSCANILFQILELGSHLISDFNHMYFKKSKNPYMALQSHIFKNRACASFLELIETRECKKTEFFFQDLSTSFDPKNTEGNRMETSCIKRHWQYTDFTYYNFYKYNSRSIESYSFLPQHTKFF